MTLASDDLEHHHLAYDLSIISTFKLPYPLIITVHPEIQGIHCRLIVKGVFNG